MTNRERLLATMDGRMPDQIPWIPRLLIWHRAQVRRGTLPERFRDMSLREVELSLGMGTPAREGRVFAVKQDGDVEVVTQREANTVLTSYRTPVGTVSIRTRSSDLLDEVGIGSLEIEHMIKGPEDYAVVEYLFTHRQYEQTYEAYLKYETDIGEDGYPLVAAGDCPFHFFLQKLAGYQAGYYHLFDYPDKVEHLLKTLEEVDREQMWSLVAHSPARLILHGVHLDSSVTPPAYFDRYITPYYRDFSAALHAEGKTLCMHADNDSRLILKQIQEAGYDMVETFTTEPQVSCTLEDAKDAWGDSMIIWGAVPSVILEDAYSDEAFEAFMRGVFRPAAPGKAFILGVADNVMPGARLDRLERITQMVQEWGNCPIQPDAIV